MRVNHLNIVVADVDRSLAFYVGLLGMQVTFETELIGEWIDTVVGLTGAHARCVFVQPTGGGCRLELLQYIYPPGVTVEPNRIANTLGLRHFALDVNDLDALHRRLTAAGVEAISAPVTVPFRLMEGIQKRLCYLRDPDGVIVEICEYTSVRKEDDR
jgi:catechol 2,3-dioxygenase-like lactoylglutathione lyase family enzyme